MIQAAGRQHLAFVGPVWDARHMGLQMRVGQHVEVVGVVLESESQPQVVARYLVADGKRWKFRSWKGSPLWVVGAR